MIYCKIIPMIVLALFTVLSLFAPASSSAPIGTQLTTCKFVDNTTCVDNDVDVISGLGSVPLASIRPYQWIAAANLYCASLSLANCAAAPMCIAPIGGKSCVLDPYQRNIARSCPGSHMRSIALCAMINSSVACKASNDTCAWSNGRCASTSPYANSSLLGPRVPTHAAWACPRLVGCCSASDDLYTYVTKCAAVTVWMDGVVGGSPQSLDAFRNSTCSGVPGCYYGNGVCTSRPNAAACGAQRTRDGCLAVGGRSTSISMTTIAAVAAIPPKSFGGTGMYATACGPQRLRPDFRPATQAQNACA